MERDLGARTVLAMQSACKELSETYRYNFSDLAILGLDPASLFSGACGFVRVVLRAGHIYVSEVRRRNRVKVVESGESG